MNIFKYMFILILSLAVFTFCCRQPLLDEYVNNNTHEEIIDPDKETPDPDKETPDPDKEKPDPDTDPDKDTPIPLIQAPYIGAFWKHNETGERLIRMKGDGDWVAEITSGVNDGLNADVVMLAELPSGYSKIQGVEINGEIEQIPESEGKTTLSGSGNISFRIGLKSSLATAETSPRYGEVTITNGDDKTIIYLRQGESASPLYGDVAFAVYNVAYTESESQFEFVGFPTMAGGFKRWSSDKIIYPPTGSVDSWDDIDENLIADVCPNGYVIPSFSDMNNLLNVINNESNEIGYVGGLYADGYFDRKAIKVETVRSGAKDKEEHHSFSVEQGNDIAYNGFVIYDESNNASLFFPTPGYRNEDGLLTDAGYRGIYWSTSMQVFNGVVEPTYLGGYQIKYKPYITVHKYEILSGNCACSIRPVKQ